MTARPYSDTDGSGWSPLRYGAFRWSSPTAPPPSASSCRRSRSGSRTTTATLTSSAFLVGAIQATNLPVLLLAVPGGMLGDLLNRKKLIFRGQTVMLGSAAALGSVNQNLARAIGPAIGGLLLAATSAALLFFATPHRS